MKLSSKIPPRQKKIFWRFLYVPFDIVGVFGKKEKHER